MTALKSAYADIILNTTKESATRILASERRAHQLQQNLSIAKEDSLAILLRLKAILEAKLISLSERGEGGRATEVHFLKTVSRVVHIIPSVTYHWQTKEQTDKQKNRELSFHLFWTF